MIRASSAIPDRGEEPTGEPGGQGVCRELRVQDIALTGQVPVARGEPMCPVADGADRLAGARSGRSGGAARAVISALSRAATRG